MPDVQVKPLMVAAGVALAILVALTVAAARLGPYLQAEIVRAIELRMEADVELQAFDLRLLPSPCLSGGGLTIRHRDRSGVPPLIIVHRFTGRAGWLGLLAAEIDEMTLDGLEVTIPPRAADAEKEGRAAADAEKERSAAADAQKERSAAADAEKGAGIVSHFSVAELKASNARLTILSKNPEKDPKVFDIFALTIHDLTLQEPSRFEASLTNPIPEGDIHATGQFGPWDAREPAWTPVRGDFRFTADLGTIKGLGGALQSEGTFDGVVARIAAAGTTHTPDFRIPTLEAAALPLDTTFRAVVDGTSGDVELESVEATLGRSPFQAKGFVIGTKGIKGKRVLLDVTSSGARMEDVLALTVKTQPPMMSGTLRLETAFDLPQGDADVVDKLRLAGTATIAAARFARDSVQEKVDGLSRRAQGRPTDQSIDEVPSDIEATFALQDGIMRLERVGYTVEGASVRLQGTYALSSRALDLSGTVRLEATVSQMVTGWKHFMLKPFDWLFRKRGAGTRLAIRVTGTADDPKFGVDLGRTLKGE